MEFDHAGIATDDLDAMVDLYRELLGVRLAHEETFQGMEVAFVDVDGGYLEVLEPTEDGPIAMYLEEHGPGIHHLAFETGDLEGAIQRARRLEVDPIDEEPREGAWGHEVAFMHPRSTGGILVEFVEH